MQRVQDQPGSTAAPPGQSTQRMTIREAGQELGRMFSRDPAERMQPAESQPDPTTTSTGKGPPAASPPQPKSEASYKHHRQQNVPVGAGEPRSEAFAPSVLERLLPAESEVRVPGNGSAPAPTLKGRSAKKQYQEGSPSLSPEQLMTSTPCSHVPGCRCMICQPSAYDGINLRKTWRDSCAPGCLCPCCMTRSPSRLAHMPKGDAGGGKVAPTWRR